MIFEGTITYIGPLESVGANGIPKQSFIVQEQSDREYKGSVLVDLLKEKTEMLQGFGVGDFVKVSLNFRANEYNGRYYNNISARKIEGGSAGTASTSKSKKKEEEDDLPF